MSTKTRSEDWKGLKLQIIAMFFLDVTCLQIETISDFLGLPWLLEALLGRASRAAPVVPGWLRSSTFRCCSYQTGVLFFVFCAQMF